MKKIFVDFDLIDFWDTSDFNLRDYDSGPVSQEMINYVEKKLGYKLPDSYIELMKTMNGGVPKKTAFPTKTRTSWSEKHIAISGILGIGKKKPRSLCGKFGSKFMIEKWEYPDIGIYVCDCPSAGHDMVCLDYRKNGKDGEPEVVHVDQEFDYKVTFLAKNFESFIRGLVDESRYDTSEEDLKNELRNVRKGRFSKILSSLIKKRKELPFEKIIRKTCLKLTREKECFALHSDELSYLMYDIQFYLFSKCNEVKNKNEYLEIYPNIIALADGGFSTGGYAPAFIDEWFDSRIKCGQIIKKRGKPLVFSEEYESDFLSRLKKYKR